MAEDMEFGLAVNGQAGPARSLPLEWGKTRMDMDAASDTPYSSCRSFPVLQACSRGHIAAAGTEYVQ